MGLTLSKLTLRKPASSARTAETRATRSRSTEAQASCWLMVAIVLRAVLSAGSASAQQPLPPLPAKVPDDGKARDAQPKRDVWGISEIDDANRICRDALAATHAVVDHLAPIKKGNCGAPAPIRLISIGRKNPVSFKPAPTINCRMLVPLKRWIEQGLQPEAARYLDARVKTVSVISSYSCRTRYGRPGARISEHAFANALDISGFRLADGSRASVLKHWGPTRSDTAKAIAAANAAARADKSAVSAGITARAPSRRASTRPRSKQPKLKVVRIVPRRLAPIPKQQPGAVRTQRRPSFAAPTKSAARDRAVVRQRQPKTPYSAYSGTRSSLADATIGRASPPLPSRRPLRRPVRQKVSLRRSGLKTQRRPASKAPARNRKELKAPYRLGGPPSKQNAAKSRFLKSVHKSACRIFGTTLGPEANEAHRNHFHVDKFPRRRGGYCE
jgi:hypothetical protein